MRLAFFVLMHANPLQALRLLKRLDNGENLFFVHVDRRAPDEVYDQIVELTRGNRQVHFVQRHVCRWGGFGIVQGTFECLRAALRSGASFDYGILLSGQDYPIQPMDRLIAAIAASGTPSEFIEVVSVGPAQPLERP